MALVLLASAARRGQAEEARTADFSGYLTKPVRRAQLLGCIRSVLVTKTAGEERPSAPLVTVHRLAEATSHTQPRVLVVEDNPVNQKVAAIKWGAGSISRPTGWRRSKRSGTAPTNSC